MDQFLEQWPITHQLLDIKYTGLQRLWWGQENVLPQGIKLSWDENLRKTSKNNSVYWLINALCQS